MKTATKLRWNNIRQSLSSLVGTKNRSRKTLSRFVHLEKLETRQLMAANLDLAGNLTIRGTSLNDTIYLTNSAGRVGVLLNGSTESINMAITGGSGSVRVSNVAAISIRSIRIEGLEGNDRLSAAVAPVGVTIDGGAGSDLLYGSTFRDSLFAGNDAATDTNTFHGLGGNDLFFGGNGTDVMNGGADVDTMFGGAGNDTLIGRGGNDVLNGGQGDDTLRGDGGDDTLRGDAGNDLLLGGLGTDNLNGGAGDFDRTDAVFGEPTLNLENPVTGPSLVVNGALGSDIHQRSQPYCVFYSHLSGLASILTGRGRNLANERIDFKGLDSSGNAMYAVSLFTSSGAPVTRTVAYNGTTAGDAVPIDGEGWVTIFEKAFMDQIRAEDPTASLWRRYWDHRTVMMIVNGSSERVTMLDPVLVTLGFTLTDGNLNTIATAVESGRLVTAATWTTAFRGTSTTLVTRDHNYTVVGVNRAARTFTLRNPWGFDMDGRGTTVGDGTDGLVTLSWADFKGSFQGFNVGVVA
jgi:Ca2+-binding RTX toxin-like protein